MFQFPSSYPKGIQYSLHQKRLDTQSWGAFDVLERSEIFFFHILQCPHNILYSLTAQSSLFCASLKNCIALNYNNTIMQKAPESRLQGFSDMIEKTLRPHYEAYVSYHSLLSVMDMVNSMSWSGRGFFLPKRLFS